MSRLFMVLFPNFNPNSVIRVKPMIKNIISGGQAGADRAALDVPIILDIPQGVWIPRAKKAEDGPLPEIYK